jgi:hypothetical protein
MKWTRRRAKKRVTNPVLIIGDRIQASRDRWGQMTTKEHADEARAQWRACLREMARMAVEDGRLVPYFAEKLRGTEFWDEVKHLINA